jgi:hypothetical protein
MRRITKGEGKEIRKAYAEAYREYRARMYGEAKPMGGGDP